MAAVTIDAKGRLLIPAELRERLGIQAGDVLFVDANIENDVLQLAKAVNPFDALAEHALEENRAGRTKDLREYAAERGIDLSSND